MEKSSAEKIYVNRELSWLKFNERVLGEARDRQSNPVLTRCKFLSITASNLDEFFMVRVASLKDLLDAGYKGRDIAGMTVKEQLDAIAKETHQFIRGQYRTFKRSLIHRLKEHGIILHEGTEELTEAQQAYGEKLFERDIFPALTPMAVDASRPFPLIRNKGLYLGVLLYRKEGRGIKRQEKKKKHPEIALVPVPAGMNRLISLPAEKDAEEFILLEELIRRHIGRLFPSCRVVGASVFRPIRNADLSIAEDEAEDLLIEIEKKLKKRQWGQVIRLDLEAGADKHLKDFLVSSLKVPAGGIYENDGPQDLTFLMALASLKGHEDLKEPEYIPALPKGFPTGEALFAAIRKKDILLQHPYESFAPVVDFVDTAAKDPDVLAIKMTLYRVSGHSPIIASLAAAASAGKQVTVLLELKARFDEAHNIEWARQLEQAGCNVIYGLVGLKTHCKITLVVRREGEELVRYLHLGTGNYNDSTARLYSDLGLFTADKVFGEDGTVLFNMLSGYGEPKKLKKLVAAPIWLKEKLLKLIEREAKNARKGLPAGICAKMNSLCDKNVIDALYDASQAGVRIDLIIRGICCLRARVPGLSENIRVRSIVGTFLEHARIFRFANGGEEEIWLSSADWMPRNLERRVELMFPVEDPELKKKIDLTLSDQLRDTVKARLMKADGTDKKPDLRSEERFESQRAAMERAKREEEGESTGFSFIPRLSHGEG